MTIESYLLLETITAESIDLNVFSYSEKKKGFGYSQTGNGLHTLQFQLDNFKGSIKIQGTLELYPGESDWIDIDFDTGLPLEAIDSTPIIFDQIRNITGNWLWIRAAYILEQGTIISIRYNF